MQTILIMAHLIHLATLILCRGFLVFLYSYTVIDDSVMLVHTPVQGKEVVDRVNGAHIPEVTKKTAQHSSAISPPLPAMQEPAKPVCGIIL